VTVPHRVSIVPRAGALGFVLGANEDEDRPESRSKLINQIAMALGGRAAEKLAFDEIDSGARADLQRANAMARRMICEYGMGETTYNLTFAGDHFDPNDLSNYSEEEKRLIYVEVKALLSESEEKARQVLVEHREALDRIASELLERETLTAEELRKRAGFPSDAGSTDGRVGHGAATGTSVKGGASDL
jgi:cell division protease FtsH